jgi:hypothetical protein
MSTNFQISPAMAVSEIDDPVVHDLVASFIDTGRISDWPVRDLLHPAGAAGQCVRAADALAWAASRAGLTAWRPAAYGSRAPIDRYGYWDAGGECEVTPETFGYTDRLNRGHVSHYWTCIQRAGRIWGVDLTAAQYGYAGPLARVCSASDEDAWAQRRIWRPQLRPSITFEQVVANRIEAGINEYALNECMVKVWLRADGPPVYDYGSGSFYRDSMTETLRTGDDYLLENTPAGWPRPEQLQRCTHGAVLVQAYR